MNQNKKIIIIIGLGLFIILVLITIFSGSPKPATKKSDVEQVTELTENFAQDFATYSSKDPDEYKNRLKAYLSTSYQADFLATYGLPKTTFLSAQEMNNYSRCLEKRVSLTKVNNDQYSAIATYKAEIVDAPGRPKKITVEKNILITVTRVANDYKVTNFSFAVGS